MGQNWDSLQYRAGILTEPQQNKTYRTVRRWFTAVLVFVILVGGLRMALKSDWLLDYVKDFAVEQANSQLNGELEIGSMRGDLLFGVTISDIRVTDMNREQVLSADSLSVQYTLPSLLRVPYRLDRLELSGAKLNVVQNADSTWNVEQLVPPAKEDDTDESDPLYWEVNRIVLENTDIDISSDILLPDGRLSVEDLFFQGAAEVFPDRWYASVDQMDLEVREGRLPEPVDFSMQAVAMDNRITLESLVINTGRSLIQSNAEIVDANRVRGSVVTDPLSGRDLAAYLDAFPEAIDLKTSLEIRGDMESLGVQLMLDSGPGGRVTADARLNVADPYLLHQLSVEAEELNAPVLLDDDTLPVVESARFEGSGQINLMDPGGADWQGDFEANGIRADTLTLDAIQFDYSYRDAVADANGRVQKKSETVEFELQGRGLLSDMPEWNGELRSGEMNLATWLQDPALESSLAFQGGIDGRGSSPDNISAETELTITGGQFGDQPFSEMRFTGTITPENITGNLFAGINESRVLGDFELTNWADIPEYTFDFALESFNIADLNGFGEFPTYMNGHLTGEGRSFALEDMRIDAIAELDSTIINGAPIDTLRAGFKISDQILRIDEGLLESPIADAEFSLRQHLLELTNPGNRLDFISQIKDPYPLSPLLGVENLAAEGSVEGHLARNDAGVLEFGGSLNLSDIMVDSLFTSESLAGSVKALVTEEPELEASLELARPVVMGQLVQDFIATGTVKQSENEITGTLGFELRNGNESRLKHGGTYRFFGDEFQLTTNTVEFETPERILVLARPFDMEYSEEVLTVDTMRVQTEDEDAFLELWVPHADSLEQEAALNAENLNIGVLQRTLMDAEMVDGYLSGGFSFKNTPDSLTVSATGFLSSLKYENGRMDSLRIHADIENEWLNFSVEGWHEDAELFAGYAQVPYLPGDPVTFDDQFYDRNISGEFHVNETDAAYWLSFMPGNLVEETRGTLSFNGEMSGQAGVPEFEGDFKFRDGQISGVPTDSLLIQIGYNHSREAAEFAGSLISRDERVLDFDSDLPFMLDLRNAEIKLPGEEDNLRVSLSTRNFNLALVNDFVDREVLRQVAGRLDGDLSIEGTLGEPLANGQIELSGGEMRVVPSGITINNIRGGLNVSPEAISLEQFSMQSGPGRIRASGSVDMENLTPGQINLSFRGDQFRVFNTSQANAIVDLQAQLTGTPESPKLNGSLSFLRGFVTLQNFGERAVEDVELEGEEAAEPLDLYEAMEIEMDVGFDRQFFIRNRQYLDLEIELGGQVDLLKQAEQEPEMFGQLEGVRGYARPLGKNFEIDEATVTFSGNIENPELNIRTVYEPPQARTDVKIFYVIEGRAQDPEFRFESEPEMELQDIISYTVFGKPFYELESWEQAVAGSGSGPSATDVALDVLLDRVEILASQRLGIDVVQIDNSRASSDSNTSILTGWYLNRRTFFALINEVSTTPKTLFMLEYMLRDNLELIILQGDDSRQGVDLRWKYDY